VLAASQAYRLPSGTRSACQASSPSKTFAYCSVNRSGLSALAMVAAISSGLGQMSFRNTGSPWSEMPSGTVARSALTRPIRANATTSIGDAR